MRNPKSSFVRLCAFAAAIALTGSVMAQVESTASTTPVKKKHLAGAARASAATPNSVGLLDHAYGILSHANHDYKGHRKHAMHAIEAAAKELGTKLSGDGHGDEKQGTSDTQLAKAQSLLQEAVGGLKGKPLHHVQEALKQLAIALKVK